MKTQSEFNRNNQNLIKTQTRT